MRPGPDVAEPAIVVMDDWQGRGAGSRLLNALVERAQEEGIWRFEAPVLAYNADAIHMLEALGQMTWKHRGREVELTFDLPEVEAAARVRPLLAVRERRGGPWPVLPRAAVAVAAGRARRTGAEPDRRGDRRLRARGRGVEAAAALAAVWHATLEVVGVQRFLLPEQPEVMAAAWAAVEELRGAWLCRCSCAAGVRRSSSPTSPPRRTPG